MARGSGAGVIPSGTSEPWRWAENEARTNNALYEMFMRQAFDAEQRELARADARLNQGIQNEFTLGRDAASRDFTRERDASHQEFTLERERARAGEAPENAFAAQFREVEAQNADILPRGWLDRTAFIESRFNPRARAKTSSATGLFQFIDSTADAVGLAREDRYDPIKSTLAVVKLARQNAQVLQRALGRNPTGEELYLAHQQGAGGAAKLLANPNARAIDIVGFEAVLNNRGTANMTAAQFANVVKNKYRSAPFNDTQQEQQTAAVNTQPVQPATGQSQPAQSAQQATPPQSRALGQRRFVPDPNNPGRAILVGG